MTDDVTTPDLDVSRVMPVRPAQIWSAWSEIGRWWGPGGFTSTVRAYELRGGGRFDVVMHGPDGSRFENVYVFEDVTPAERVAWVHQGSPEHGLAPSRSEMTIEALDATPRTRVTLRSFYATESDRRRHLDDFRAADGTRQLLERLEAVAARL